MFSLIFIMTRAAERTNYVNQLKADYRKLAITANRRMTLLEKLSNNPDYGAVLGYAYKNVAYNLQSLGETSGRFSHDIEKLSAEETDIRHLSALIASAKEFLQSPTSLKSGIDKVYGKRANTLNKKYGTSFTADNMKTFFESRIFEKMNQKYGSKVTMRIIGTIQNNAKNVIDSIEKARKQHRKLNIEVDGLNIADKMPGHDRTVLLNLAKIYAKEKDV